MRSIAIGMLGALMVFSLAAQQAAPVVDQNPNGFTAKDYLNVRDNMKNWGRWGPDDQKGLGNLLTPEKALAAMKLARAGIVVSLARPVPQQQATDVPANAVFQRRTTGASGTVTLDTITSSYHGFSTTHTDAGCHFHPNDQMYNGYSVAGNVTVEDGCKKDDIMQRAGGVVTRAVLYDIPQLKGVDWLEPGTPVHRSDLEAWEKKVGVKVGPGDALLLYVGHWRKRKADGPYPTVAGRVAGYHPDVSPFLKARDVAFIGHDVGQEFNPRPGFGPQEGIVGDPVHVIMLYTLGGGVLDNLDMDKAVEVARRLKRYEFMITFAPLPIEGGSGSPVNPIAVF